VVPKNRLTWFLGKQSYLVSKDIIQQHVIFCSLLTSAPGDTYGRLRFQVVPGQLSSVTIAFVLRQLSLSFTFVFLAIFQSGHQAKGTSTKHTCYFKANGQVNPVCPLLTTVVLTS
jgi:hypothetical protein